MLKNIKYGLLLVLVVLISTTPTYAHHSFAATFSEKIIVVEGQVERFKYSNPHVIVYFNVTGENGKETQWLAEGGSATSMRNKGWDRDTLSEGDYIRVTGEATRNGSPMISMVEDGSVQFIEPAG